jgi:hypothetical protein
MSLPTIAFLIFIVMIVVTRSIFNKANRELPADKKIELIDLASKNRWLNYVILGIMVAMFIGVVEYEFYKLPGAWTFYTVIVTILLGVNALMSNVKLKKHNFPKSYINQVNLISIIRIVCIVLFFILIGNN